MFADDVLILVFWCMDLTGLGLHVHVTGERRNFILTVMSHEPFKGEILHIFCEL